MAALGAIKQAMLAHIRCDIRRFPTDQKHACLFIHKSIRMDTPRYSLKDIFGLLRDATSTLNKTITVVDGDNIKTDMELYEYIAMAFAHELTDDMSKFAPSGSTKEEVIDAMKASGYEDIAFPVYEHFGTVMRGGRKSRKQSRRRRGSKN